MIYEIKSNKKIQKWLLLGKIFVMEKWQNMCQMTNNFLQQKFSPTIVDHFPHRIVDHHISKIVTKNIFVWLFIYFNFMWIKIVHIDQALSGEACYCTCYRTCTHPHTCKSVWMCVKLHAQMKLLAALFSYTIACVWSRYVALLYVLKIAFLLISLL